MRLQVEPEFRLDTEPMSESKRRVSSDRTLAIDNLAYPVRGHIDLSCELCRCHSDFRQFFLNPCLTFSGEILPISG